MLMLLRTNAAGKMSNQVTDTVDAAYTIKL